MTVYVDDMRMKARVGMLNARWSHLFSDTSIEELEEFAERLRLNPKYLQNEPPGFLHYDVVDRLRDEAIHLGARVCSWRDTPRLHFGAKAKSA